MEKTNPRDDRWRRRAALCLAEGFEEMNLLTEHSRKICSLKANSLSTGGRNRFADGKNIFQQSSTEMKTIATPRRYRASATGTIRDGG